MHRLDLNLLVAFEALMIERSVTRAAERMSVGQPAMSASLARLRAFFNDPLLVREGRSLVPTSRALELFASFQEALDLIDSTLRTKHDFDPATAHRTFTVMASDYLLLVLLGPLLATLHTEAPDLRIIIRPTTQDCAEQVDRSRVDLLIRPEESVGEVLPARSVRLFDDHLMCAVASDNAEVGDNLTEEQFRTLPLVSYDDGTQVASSIEHRFSALGIDRVITVGTESLVIQPLVVSGSRLMALIPERLGRYFGDRLGIRLLAPVHPLEPVHQAMFWAPRADADPAHRWLRERVLRAAATLDGAANRFR